MTSPTRTESTDVVVIGGGIAGLVVAWQLARAGRRPLLLEAGAVVGGVLSSHRVGGLTLDAGAESYATTRPSVGELIDDLGLRAAVVRPSPAGAWVRHSSGTAPLPAGGLLGIPARPWAADVRRVVGAAGSARACLDRVLPRSSTEASYATLGARLCAFIDRAIASLEPDEGMAIAFSYDLDWELTQRAMRHGGGEQRRSRTYKLNPRNVYDIVGFGAGKRAADAYFTSQSDAPISRHHSLCDARALRIAYEAASQPDDTTASAVPSRSPGSRSTTASPALQAAMP